MEWHHALIVTLIVQGAFLSGLLFQILTIRGLDRMRSRRDGPLVQSVQRTLSRWANGEADVGDVVAALRPLGGRRAIRVLAEAADRARGEAWETLVTRLALEPWVVETRRQSTSRRYWHRRERARLLSVTATLDDLPEVIRLLEDRHPAVSIAIVPALERVQGPALTGAVLGLLPRLPPALIAYFGWTLRRSGAPVATDLIGRLRDSEGTTTLRLAEFGAHLADPALRPCFLALAGSANPEIRARAAVALGTMPGAGAVEAVERLARDEAWQVRLQAVKALGRLGAHSSLVVLSDALRDPMHWVRLRAGGALMRLGEAGRQVLVRAAALPEAGSSRGPETDAEAGARDVAHLLLTQPGWALEDVAA